MGDEKETRGSARAVIYCRVSSYDQLKGLSLETQLQACRGYCAENGWEVAEVFIERAESARTTDRTELQRLLGYCRRRVGHIQFLVVAMLDRLARNQYDHHALKALLQKNGITVRAVSQPIDDSSTGLLMEGILAAFSEFENNLRRDRCKGGMQAAAERGRWVFPPPVGYESVKLADGSKSIAPDPETAPLVKLAFEMASSGLHGVADIARELRARGLRGRRGAQVSLKAVHKLLRKPIYYGRVKVENWGVDVEGAFEPLIDEETFLRTQDALGQRGRGKKGAVAAYSRAHPDFPLRRFVRCLHCKRPLTGAWSTGNTARYPYYNCPGCRRVNVRKERLEGAFVSLLDGLRPRSEVLELLGAAVLERWHEEEKAVNERRKAIERRVAAHQERKERIVDSYVYEAAIDKETYLRHLRRIDEELTLAELELYDAKLEEFDIEGTVAFAGHLVNHASRLWLEAGLKQRQRLQKLFFPEGLTYDGEAFSNPLTCPFFNNLEAKGDEGCLLVERKGFEPSTPTMRTSCSPN